MGLLQDKFAKYDLPQQYMAQGVYPYFRTINSHQDTEVEMDGKKVLMFGSNAYMGLTYDQRIIDGGHRQIWYRMCRFTFPQRNS